MPDAQAIPPGNSGPLANPGARSLLPCEARGLVFTAGGKRLIDDLSMRLTVGPLTVIMGPNGAGKSVLLRLFHGLLTPSAGEVRWNGSPGNAALRRRQAMVFQAPVMLRRSVAANIDFVLKLRGPSAENRENILESVGLAALAQQPARLLSGGEKQRLALARALAMKPEVIFLDEPTANLDPTSTLLIENIVTTAHRSGTKVVFVTHDIGQARRLADEVVFIHRGRLDEHTGAEQFFASPTSSAARDYLAGRLVL